MAVDSLAIWINRGNVDAKRIYGYTYVRNATETILATERERERERSGTQRFQRAMPRSNAASDAARNAFRRCFGCCRAVLSLRNFPDGSGTEPDGHSHVRVLASFHESE